MKRKLDRLLRIRALLEDLSRLDLERKIADTRYLERAAEREGRLALATRAEALRLLGEEESAPSDSWLMRIADAEILSWKEGRIKVLAAEGRSAVQKSREALLTRRTERRQVEALLATAERAEEKSQARKEQSRTDDWFQSGSTREGGKRK